MEIVIKDSSLIKKLSGRKFSLFSGKDYIPVLFNGNGLLTHPKGHPTLMRSNMLPMETITFEIWPVCNDALQLLSCIILDFEQYCKQEGLLLNIHLETFIGRNPLELVFSLEEHGFFFDEDGSGTDKYVSTATL